ncbi:MAG: beta/gamma crystallin family protein [Pseudomonadota bacterium]
MKTLSRLALAGAALALANQAVAQVTLYEHEGWRGRAVSANEAVPDLSRYGFNDRASSVVVEHGQWEVCEDADFRGRCMVLRHGSYESLRGMGMNNRISSMRPLGHRERYENEAPAALPQPTYEYRRRPEEAVFEVPVDYVHAVMGAPEQRCWVERQQVSEGGRGANAGGALAGALIGGILGHQIGGGSGRDAATAGGAIAGAVIGANAGANGGGKPGSSEREVRRCENVPAARPEYWEVGYRFHGVEHRIQMASEPGPRILVNRDGIPRQ